MKSDERVQAKLCFKSVNLLTLIPTGTGMGASRNE
jgi:hypothetical protein